MAGAQVHANAAAANRGLGIHKLRLKAMKAYTCSAATLLPLLQPQCIDDYLYGGKLSANNPKPYIKHILHFLNAAAA